MFRIISKI